MKTTRSVCCHKPSSRVEGQISVKQTLPPWQIIIRLENWLLLPIFVNLSFCKGSREHLSSHLNSSIKNGEMKILLPQ